jgi:hypothetical protein
MKRDGQNCLRLWLKRLQVALCVIPLLAGQTGVFAALLAAASTLAGSHTTHASMSQGGFMIVLSHERGQPGRPNFLAHHHPTSPAHHHGLTVWLVCALGGSTQGLANHEACFSRGGQAEALRHKLQPAFEQSAAAATAVARPQISSFVSVPCFPLQCPHALVGLPQAVQEMRTTLLLI